MKKILIFSHAMEIGGAESALLGLLESIDKGKYSVDLFLMRHSGELYKYIPEGINILPEIPEYACIEIPATEALKKRQLRIVLGRFIGKTLAKLREFILHYRDSFIPLEYSHKYTKCFMPVISKTKYDIAISFQSPHYYLIEKVRSEKKIAWIHTDYAAIEIDRNSELAMWSKYDHIVSISESVTQNFLEVFPTLKDKVILIENMIPIEHIKMLSEEFSVENEIPADNSVHLLSIGRFCPAKNFESIPEICRRLIALGHDVTWYIIGYGDGLKSIKEAIERAEMQNHVIILGKKDNPYPYIKACDLYVQPSKYEGKSIAVREAQYLGKPVVIAAYPSSSSQLQNGYDGVIVPLNNEECAKGISDLMNNPELIDTIRKNCSRSCNNGNEIFKLYKLIEDGILTKSNTIEC